MLTPARALEAWGGSRWPPARCLPPEAPRPRPQHCFPAVGSLPGLGRLPGRFPGGAGSFAQNTCRRRGRELWRQHGGARAPSPQVSAGGLQGPACTQPWHRVGRDSLPLRTTLFELRGLPQVCTCELSPWGQDAPPLCPGNPMTVAGHCLPLAQRRGRGAGSCSSGSKACPCFSRPPSGHCPWHLLEPLSSLDLQSHHHLRGFDLTRLQSPFCHAR
uniref:Uncharacterized protein n=1 Tax=Rousettus aegyptiacus TaxID=9407 RepID=A0A7J8BSJ2_ROUAE|nr:hypothetical protein HJG63_009660 [Rousettus aegyptiacus]